MLEKMKKTNNIVNEINLMRNKMGLNPLDEGFFRDTYDKFLGKKNTNHTEQGFEDPSNYEFPVDIANDSPENSSKYKPSEWLEPMDNANYNYDDSGNLKGATWGNTDDDSASSPIQPTPPINDTPTPPPAPVSQSDPPVSHQPAPPVNNKQKQPAPSTNNNANLQLYHNLKSFFKNIFNYAGQVTTNTSGAAQPLKKLTQPEDITDIINLFEFSNSGLPNNEINRFKANVLTLTNIIKSIQKLQTKDNVLNKFIEEIKTNPISNINNINALFDGDTKSVQIFIDNFNKTLYSTSFGEGRGLIDTLKKIDINKLNEAAQPPNIDNQRRIFIANFSQLIKSMYGVFNYLIGQKQKGLLNNTPKNTNTTNNNVDNTVNNNTNNVDNTVNSVNDTENDTTNNTNNVVDTDNDTENIDNDTENDNTADNVSDNTDDIETDSQGKGKYFYDMRNNTLNENILDVIKRHDNLINLISENLDALNEFGSNQEVMQQGMDSAVEQGTTSRIFKELNELIPELSTKIAAKYKAKYGEDINRIKLSGFLETIITSLTKTDKRRIFNLINNSGVKMDVNAYNRMLSDMKTKETTSQTFMPEIVGNYDLRKINQNARIALSNKAAEIIARNTDLTADQTTMVSVIKQLLDDIVHTGKKQIPTLKK